MDINNLPKRGGTIDTDGDPVRRADRTLLGVLDGMNDIYGWVQVLEVLLDGVVARYPGGHRFAAYMTSQRVPGNLATAANEPPDALQVKAG